MVRKQEERVTHDSCTTVPPYQRSNASRNEEMKTAGVECRCYITVAGQGDVQSPALLDRIVTGDSCIHGACTNGGPINDEKGDQQDQELRVSGHDATKVGATSVSSSHAKLISKSMGNGGQ